MIDSNFVQVCGILSLSNRPDLVSGTVVWVLVKLLAALSHTVSICLFSGR